MRGLNWSEGVNEALGVGLGEGLKRPLRWEGRPLRRGGEGWEFGDREEVWQLSPGEGLWKMTDD